MLRWRPLFLKNTGSRILRITDDLAMPSSTRLDGHPRMFATSTRSKTARVASVNGSWGRERP